jgi:molybdopterin-guanine dinucleotide biosynthesis protein MobB
MDTPVITFIGPTGAGKTTLMETVVATLTRRGVHVGTVKHHSHAGFDIDHPGKDSWRHARAGSEHVVIAAPDKIASYRLLEREISLDEILSQMDGLEIILVEGYRMAGKPTIEFMTSGNGSQPRAPRVQLLAVVSETALDLGVPQFHRGDGIAVTDFLAQRFLKAAPPHRAAK